MARPTRGRPESDPGGFPCRTTARTLADDDIAELDATSRGLTQR